MRELPPLNALLAFEVVARTGSVRAAAESMSVTPGAVSRQLRLLEEHFGTTLFQRQGRGLMLTHAGNAYYQQISGHFDGLRRAGQVLQRSAGRAVLRLHSFTTFATRWLIPRLSTFQLAHPAIEVRLTTASDWDDATDFDAAIRLGHGDWPQQHATALVENLLLPVCRPTLTRKAIFNTANLAQHTLLSVRGRPDDWQLWCEAFGVNIHALHNWRELESSALAYQAALEGQGIALAQRVLVEKELDEGTLMAMEQCQLDCGNLTYYLVWRDGSPKETNLLRLEKWLTGRP
ncbi:LysR family glycine cleavage system transcriptional activator [Erwinia toletana]|uniref:LysR family glycine cleavage system transcriptional activator n=1 Tax=Winslowiella toletana TaxID=92490 RepID=A0ABS4PF89_9GAMM|nr:LysR substrate-binding domain-containing protein [Winslowiella toletana]MBP2171306.1 LysR family glycine cleavage system transcriptional activator [Winslowiella toletana]